MMNICLLFSLFLLMFSILSFFISINFIMNNFMFFMEFNLMSFNSTSITMTIFLDWMSLMFMSVVMLISSSVIYYSKNYMENDLFLNRFIYLILIFIFSMILLIISPNLISILLGWDGLGLVSYCLVIYYQNIKSFNAGMLTILSNRIGDVFLLMSIAWMLNFGSWNFLFYLDFMKTNNEMMMILFFVMISSFTKSAQIPFSSWLPAAMAAPTPVSSLVHSSTLVTAGVYLLIRFNKVFNNELTLWFLMLSLLTMFMSGLNAIFEFDLKKIIALSTLSQLGLMMSVLFLGMSELAFFHLLMHALFKALLFMCAGVMIHNLMNFQDIRFMGVISIQMPMISVCFNFSNLALCGFPFLAGFYSKDLILEYFFLTNFNLFVFFIMFFSTILTVMYTFRLIFFSMIMNYNMISLNFLSSDSWKMNKSMLNLFIMVIMGGSMMSWLIFPSPFLICLPLYFKIMPLMFIFLGVILGYFNYKLSYFLKFNNLNYFVKIYLSTMWFMPIISTWGVIYYPLKMSKILSTNLDQGWTENLMGRSVIKMLFNYSSFLDLLIFYFNFMLIMFLYFLLIWYYLMI